MIVRLSQLVVYIQGKTIVANSQHTPNVPGCHGMSYFGQDKTDVVKMAW